MALNKERILQRIKDFNLRDLFIEDLGWDQHHPTFLVDIDDKKVNVQSIAQKRGMVAYQCELVKGDGILTYTSRKRIERNIAKITHEHLIIFLDRAKTIQIWQWVKREPGKPRMVSSFM